MSGWPRAVLLAVALMVGTWALLGLLARRLPAGLLRDLASFVPDCVTTVRRLRRDPRVPRRAKVVVALAGLWLLSPVDLLPDFLPVIGRTWGIRNLSLAAGMYAATGANRRQWWRLQPAVDALDFLAITTEWRRGAVPGPAAGLMAAAALAATTLGALSVAGESEQPG